MPLFTVGQVPHPLLMLLLQELVPSSITPSKRNNVEGTFNAFKNPGVVFVSLPAAARFISCENVVQFKVPVFIVLIF